MQIKKSLSIISLTGILVINASSHSYSQSSGATNEEIKDGKTSDYTIKKGDTLWDISEEYLKNPFLWPNIWEKNDYIRNPDLIYPGNRLIIPSFMPSKPETAKEESPAADSSSDQVVIPEADKPSPVSAPVMPSPPKKPAVPVMPAVVRPLVTADTVEAGGYIVNNIESYGVLRGSKEDRTIFADGDKVNISLSDGHAGKVSAGEKFTVFRTSGPVIHPSTKKKAGFLFIPTGVIVINRVQGKDASGEIIKSYNYTSIGDHIQPYIPAHPVKETKRSTEKIQGYIIESQEGLSLNAQFSIVYLDKGSADGITPGTIMNVIKEKNDVIGELRVVSSQDTTSTAQVIKSSEPFGVGTKVTTITK